MAVYSRNNAFVRFQYCAEYPDCYAYAFAPTGGFGAFSGPRPIALNLHPGGWTPPGMDETNDQYPALGMTSRVEVNDLLGDHGCIVVLVEYPLAADVASPYSSIANPSKAPIQFLATQRLIQFVKDQCGPGGIFDQDGATPGNPDSVIGLGYSAGSWNLLMSQWIPESWNLTPRMPGLQSTMSGSGLAPRSDHKLAAMVLQGPPVCPVSDDPSATIGAEGVFYSPLVDIVAEPWIYKPKVRIAGTLTGAVTVGQVLQNAAGGLPYGTVTLVHGIGANFIAELTVTKGDADDFVAGQTYEVQGATSNTVATITPTILDRYGWLQVPQALKEAVSPILLLGQMTEDDLDYARSIPLMAYNTTNPSVYFQAEDSLTEMIPNKFGADDSHDIMLLEHTLEQLGGFTTLFRWGSPAAASSIPRQNIVGASNAAPIVITVEGDETGIRSGDSVEVAGVVGNAAANGVWPVDRISATQFSLRGSRGNGTYVSGGGWVFDNPNGNYYTSDTPLTEMLVWLQETVQLKGLV